MMKRLKNKTRTQLRREREAKKRKMRGLATSIKREKRKKASICSE
jgi:hypothetical protein